MGEEPPQIESRDKGIWTEKEGVGGGREKRERKVVVCKIKERGTRQNTQQIAKMNTNITLNSTDGW